MMCGTDSYRFLPRKLGLNKNLKRILSDFVMVQPFRWWKILLAVLLAGFLLPETPQVPVQGATATDWHPESFWYEPWGSSGVHKGVDIFGARGTAVNSSSSGWVLYAGEFKKGGKVVLVLGPKWRIRYYAHLDSIAVNTFAFVSKSTTIGSLGDSGNAVGKAPHLHYSVLTLFPYPWRLSFGVQGWKKMFYLNPQETFR